MKIITLILVNESSDWIEWNFKEFFLFMIFYFLHERDKAILFCTVMVFSVWQDLARYSLSLESSLTLTVICTLILRDFRSPFKFCLYSLLGPWKLLWGIAEAIGCFGVSGKWDHGCSGQIAINTCKVNNIRGKDGTGNNVCTFFHHLPTHVRLTCSAIDNVTFLCSFIVMPKR